MSKLEDLEAKLAILEHYINYEISDGNLSYPEPFALQRLLQALTAISANYLKYHAICDICGRKGECDVSEHETATKTLCTKCSNNL